MGNEDRRAIEKPTLAKYIVVQVLVYTHYTTREEAQKAAMLAAAQQYSDTGGNESWHQVCEVLDRTTSVACQIEPGKDEVKFTVGVRPLLDPEGVQE